MRSQKVSGSNTVLICICEIYILIWLNKSYYTENPFCIYKPRYPTALFYQYDSRAENRNLFRLSLLYSVLSVTSARQDWFN